MAREPRPHFRFYYKETCLYDGYFDGDSDMITFAQGLCVGIRNFRSTAEIDVYKIDEQEGTSKLYRVQR